LNLPFSFQPFKRRMRANEERETVTLIGSDKVEGTAVYRADDKQIGLIERVMIDKRSGVSYAALAAFSASETIVKLIADEVKQWSRVFLAANMKRE
jgi:hypothetical protein